MIVEKALEYCRNTLRTVSRSFSLTIPLVEKNILVPVLVGYLEARILDSFEDEKTDDSIGDKTRMECLDKVISIINNSNRKDISQSIEELRGFAVKAISNPHYLDLTMNMDKVMVVHNTLGMKEKHAISQWFSEMTSGMKKYLNTRIDTFEQLDDYCYYVGGTVAGLTTQLVIQKSKTATKDQIQVMKKNNREFGLFLQKVNITRDFREDLKQNEKIFWPHSAFAQQNITPEMALQKRYQKKALVVLEQMTTNARKHASPSYEGICAIPSDYQGFKKALSINFLMGVETLNRLENNPDVFYSDRPVKITPQTKTRILADPIGELERIAL